MLGLNKNNQIDLIIIGGSGAACAAAIYAVRSGLKTMLITDNFGGQLLLTESVENYPGFTFVGGLEIAKKLEEHVKSYKDVQIVEGEKVTEITKTNKGFKVKIESGKEFESLTIIVGTGRRPKKLQKVKKYEELEGKGVTYCAICDGPLFKGKDTAVIGGGYAGVEEALYLSDISPTVYVLEYNDSLRGEQITIDQVLKKKNIKIILNAKVTEILGDKFVSGIKYEDTKSGKTKEIKVAGIFINVGENPNSEFIPKEVKKDKTGAIEVNMKNETNIAGFYAAGDVTTYPIHQLVTSAGEGCKAALSVNEYVKQLKSKNTIQKRHT